MANKNYFTLYEFFYSQTALSKKIPNWPEDFWVIDNIKGKMLPVLNDFREAWGSGIRINSGYRSKALNDAVGGAKSSMHLKGLAVDLFPVNGDFENFVCFAVGYFDAKGYDQLIIEQSGSSRWLHYSIENNEGKQRRYMFNIKL